MYTPSPSELIQTRQFSARIGRVLNKRVSKTLNIVARYRRQMISGHVGANETIAGTRDVVNSDQSVLTRSQISL